MNDDQATVQVGEAEISKIGLGTWQNTGEQCARSVKTALEAGYRHIDTAQMYDNERQVGNGIEIADVGREDIFLTTKVWRSNLRSEDVQETVHGSLDRLDTEYIDLLLIHIPRANDVSRTPEPVATQEDLSAQEVSPRGVNRKPATAPGPPGSRSSAAGSFFRS